MQNLLIENFLSTLYPFLLFFVLVTLFYQFYAWSCQYSTSYRFIKKLDGWTQQKRAARVTSFISLILSLAGLWLFPPLFEIDNLSFFVSEMILNFLTIFFFIIAYFFFSHSLVASWGSFLNIKENPTFFEGIYLRIRHPQTFALINMIYGIAFGNDSLTQLILASLFTVILISLAKEEEKSLIYCFGDLYVYYQFLVPMLFPKLSPTWNFHKELEKLMNFCENSQEKREIRASGEIDRMIQRGLISEEEAEEWQRTLNIAAWPSKEIQRSLNSPSIPTSASVSTSSTSMMNERSVIESPYTGYEQLNDIFRQGVFSQSGWMACNSIAIQYLNGLSSAHHSNYMKKQKTQHNLITLLFPWITIIKDRMQTITNSNDSNLTGKQTDSEEDEISGEELFEDENRREPSHERRSRTISSVKHSDSMRLSVQHPESVSPGSCYLVESDKTFQPKQKGSQPYLPLFVVEVVSNEKEGSVLCKRFSMGYPRMKFPVASLLEINADYILHNEKRIQSSESKKWLKQQNIL